MNFLIRALIAIMVIGGIARWWQQQDREQQALQKPVAGAPGFQQVPMPDGAENGKVLIFAPINCPKEGAQRARAMAEQLSAAGIPNQLTSRYAARAFQPTEENMAAYKRLDGVMRGELPIVLFNGVGKANPTPDEVIAAWRRLR